MRKVNAIMAYIANFFLVAIMGLTVLDVIGNFFGHPILGAEEIVEFMASLMIAFVLPVAHEDKTHIGVDILYIYFSNRTKRTVNIFVSFISWIFFFVIAYVCFDYAGYIKKVGTVSPTLEIPFFYIIYAISFAFLMLGITTLVEFVDLLRGKRYE